MKGYERQALAAKPFQLRGLLHQNWAAHKWNTSEYNSSLPRTNTSDSKSTTIFIALFWTLLTAGKTTPGEGKEPGFNSHPRTRAFQHTGVLMIYWGALLINTFIHLTLSNSNKEFPRNNSRGVPPAWPGFVHHLRCPYLINHNHTRHKTRPSLQGKKRKP